MSTAEDLKKLDQRLTKLRNRSDEYKLAVRKADDAAERYTDEIEAIAGRVKHNQGLISHMRTAADLVDIKEFETTAENLEDAQDDLMKAKTNLLKEERKKSRALEVITTSEAEIAEIRGQIAEYGQVIPLWPDKHE
jgi:chromosome segregation ATPase